MFVVALAVTVVVETFALYMLAHAHQSYVLFTFKDHEVKLCEIMHPCILTYRYIFYRGMYRLLDYFQSLYHIIYINTRQKIYYFIPSLFSFRCL